MKKLQWSFLLAVTTTLLLAGCGSGGAGGDPAARPTPPYYKGEIAAPNIQPLVNNIFSFDINWVDSVKGLYYYADRTNKSLTVFSTITNSLIKVITGGFTGGILTTGAPLLTTTTTGAVNNGISGPNGATSISAPGTAAQYVYVGDVNKLMVVDTNSKSVVATVGTNAPAALGGTGLRTDEGCYDSVHKRYIIATPDVDASTAPAGKTPFLTVLDATIPAAPVVTGYISFFDPTDLTGATLGTAAAGLEQCAYDAVNDQFLINNDKTVANPFGEVNAFGGAAVAAMVDGVVVNYTALAGYKVFALGGPGVSCNPRGLDLGPGTTALNAEFAINCSNSTGKAMVTMIMNRSTGAPLATAAVGGGDQMMYDKVSNRYYISASNWNATGIRSASPIVTPVLGVVNATSGTVVARLPAGQGSHAIAVDGATGQAYMPHTAATSAVCPSCLANPNFVTGGISLYVTQ